MKNLIISAVILVGGGLNIAFASNNSPVSFQENNRKSIRADLVKYSASVNFSQERAKFDIARQHSVSAPYGSQGERVLLNDQSFLPNRGKKVVSISQPGFESGLLAHCQLTSLVQIPSHMLSGSGLECRLKSARAVIFLTFDGVLYRWLDVPESGSLDDLDALLTSLETADIKFNIQTIEVLEKELPKIIE